MTKKEFDELNCFEQAIQMEDCVVNAMGYEELAIGRCHDINFFEEEN